ncbi:hypothetical protein [Pontibacter ramchanderi]|uniref:hypothetical protein n=1 Tax=Pontibacter ramchanderi TaxID=1179743 RepID=UPI0015D5AF8A|nr:hypothetical protein [Pontibacter ramchanderi]
MDDSLGVSRSFSDGINDEMLREERLEREHNRMAEHKLNEPTDSPANGPDNTTETK